MRTIDAVFKDAFDALPELKSFGIGPRAMSNIVEGVMPRVWIHNVTSFDNVGMSGAIETEYLVLLDLSTYFDFDGKLDDARDLMQTLDAAWVRYIDRIGQDSRLAAYPKDIRREEHYHQLDHNLIGFGISLKVKLREGLAYFCEAPTTSYYEPGYLADGYFVKQ